MRDRIPFGSILVAATLVAAATLVPVARATPADAPLFTTEDGGRTFVYRSRPGDHPSAVAGMFGIPPNDLPAFLAANGISDPTRVASGFVYHIPNAAARELSDRVGALERDNARLTRALGESSEQGEALTKQLQQARAVAAAAESRAARLANAERWWLGAQVLIVLLVLGLGTVVAIAVAALRRQRQAERFARTLAQELEEKRRIGLAERQESGRRILELESKLKELETKLGLRVVVGGRSG